MGLKLNRPKRQTTAGYAKTINLNNNNNNCQFVVPSLRGFKLHHIYSPNTATSLYKLLQAISVTTTVMDAIVRSNL